MSAKKLAYKLVRRNGDNYISLSGGDQYYVEYNIGQRSSPVLTNSKLFVFHDLTAACEFLKYWKHAPEVVIIEGWAGETIKYSQRPISFISLNWALEDFWSRWRKDILLREGSIDNYLIISPPGTCLCDWFKPIRELNSEYVKDILAALKIFPQD